MVKLPYREAYALDIMILGPEVDGGELRVMMADPSSKPRWRRFREFVTASVKVSVAERKLVRRGIQEYYPIRVQLPSVFGVAGTKGAGGESTS